VKARSIFKQTKPYRRSWKSSTNSRFFEFNNIKGTLVGFRCPPYLASLNFPGYHFHFIDEARKAGGHLMELRSSRPRLRSILALIFAGPADGGDFYALDLTKERQQ